MYYEDTERMPAYFADYEERALKRVEFAGQMARELLREAGIEGLSKMKAGELRALAREKVPDQVDTTLRSRARLFRWSVAHGFAISYGELESLEAAAGIEVNPEAKIADTMLQFAETYAEPDPKHPGECRWKKLVFAAEHVGYDWEAGAPHETLGDVYANIAVQKWLDEN